MPENKVCPFCGEEIKGVAVKCRFCGSQLSDVTSPSGSLRGIDLVRKTLGDRYEVLHEIGKGGMATVYKAIQKNLNRPVALKVVHQNLLHDEEFISRFHREAKMCASMSHPNIVTVYDEGEVLGVHFMAMEYLDGNDLRTVIEQEGILTPGKCLHYLLAVAKALDHAHSRGFIHRDVKSGNIFITVDGRVVLMDFGIAHAALGGKITRAGAVIGTPEYMSPEQADGKKVDHRTDLYSLGVIMYECLTGTVPFHGSSPVSTLYKVANDRPDITKLKAFPEKLKKLNLGLLQKDPSNRPKTAKHLIENILKVQEEFRPHLGYRKKERAHRQIKKTKKKEQKGAVKLVWSIGRKKYPETVPQHVIWILSGIGLGLVVFLVVLLVRDWQTEQDAYLSPEDISIRAADLEMVFIEGGAFTQGCVEERQSNCFANELPVHEVQISGFYIGKFPVTQGQWSKVMGSNPSSFSGCDDCPVNNVSWMDAMKFIERLNRVTNKNYRLPTEAEWEFAARGGNNSQQFRFSGSTYLSDVGWYDRNSNGLLKPVGSLNPNEIGLYDMSGNINEWCYDVFSEYSSNGSPRLSGSSRGTAFHVIRGGSYSSPARECRVYFRSSRHLTATSPYIGFRLARDP